ncbi:MFS transporter [Curtobacterium flaccumfaciens UCD-AKU]|uniref:MFS transporter n=1 Tax=Curtobacterium flaccumfaciens TaxID=2035 RepID=UPI00036A239B|nr:MFS transporter [Curtobacterium flaccumfaciens]EYT63971.1 MFS transporter [Curtobacterium flaccumfaciens UCD-AKU]
MTTARAVPGITKLFINRSFGLLWSAQAFSSFGEYVMASTVTVWLATSLAATDPLLPVYIGAVVAAAAVPRVILAPFAGVLVDRWTARTVMLTADVVRAALYVPLLAAIALLETTALPVALILMQLLVSTVSQFFDPARSALIQAVVPTEQRAGAAGRSTFSSMGAGIIATMAGPALFAAVGPRPALIIDASSFLVSAMLVGLVRERKVHSSMARTHYWRELTAGILIAWRSRKLRLLLVGMAAYGVSLGVNNSTLSLFALKTVRLSAEQYGIVSAMFSVGGLLGAFVAPSIVRRLRPERALAIALLLLATTYFTYSTVRSFTPAILLMLLAGLLFSVYIVAQGPILQAEVPSGAMGRVSSLTAPVLAISSLVATAVTSNTLSAVQASTASAMGFPAAIAIAAIVMGAASVVLVIGTRRSI